MGGAADQCHLLSFYPKALGDKFNQQLVGFTVHGWGADANFQVLIVKAGKTGF